MSLFLKKSQVSIEYLVILGFALLLLIPIVSIFQASSVQSEELANSNLVVLSGRAFLANAESVFYQGRGSRVKVELFFPSVITNVTTFKHSSSSQTELVFSTTINSVETDFVFFSPINITFGRQGDPCNTSSSVDSSFVSPGNKVFFVQSCGGFISIYEFTG